MECDRAGRLSQRRAAKRQLRKSTEILQFRMQLDLVDFESGSIVTAASSPHPTVPQQQRESTESVNECEHLRSRVCIRTIRFGLSRSFDCCLLLTPLPRC